MRVTPADLRAGWFDWRRKRFWAWVLLVLYALIGFVVVPWIARGAIVDAAHEQLGLDATLDDVDVNPFVLSARLERFALADRSGSKMLAFDDAFANFQLSSLFRWAWTFDEVTLTNPFVRIVRAEDGTANLKQLVPKSAPESEPEPEAPPSKLVGVLIHTLALRGGRAEIEDHAAENPFSTTLGPIDVVLREVGTIPRPGGKSIVIHTEAGGRLELSGTVEVDPLNVDGHAAITGVPLAKVTAYLPPELAVAVTDGTADLAFDYAIARPGKLLSAKLSSLAFGINRLHVDSTARAEPRALLNLPALKVTGGTLAWPERSVAIADVTIEGAELAAWRDADQRFVWEQWLGTPSAPEAPEAPAAGTPDTRSEATQQSEATTQSATTEQAEAGAATPKADATEATWDVRVARIAIEQSTVRFDDAGVEPAAAVGVTGIEAVLENMSLEEDAELPVKVAFNVARPVSNDASNAGTFALDGKLTVLPAVRFTGHAKLDGLDLTLARPYVTAYSYLALESGAVGLEGELASTPEELFSYDGNLVVNDLSVVSGPEPTRLVAWKRLALGGIAVRMDEQRAEVADIVLDKPYSRVHIAKDGTINLAQVMKTNDSTEGSVPTDAGSQPAAPESGEPLVVAEPKPWTVKVGRTRVTNGEMSYTDENLPIPFAIAMHQLAGELGTFDTTSRAPARLSLEGGVGEFGVAKIKGALQPLDFERSTTIDGKFENISMPNASPYAIRFAGHKIASGKLDLRVQYEVKQGQLKGDHRIVLRDFALGEKVDYPDALDLPFGLAISLLKGPDGNIDVDLPIEGDMNDPSFKIGGVIVKALVNLVTKIVTAPFSLLGRLVGFGGDSEDLENVEFAAGRSDLAPPEREKVLKLSQALAQRPQLKLEVPGVVDREADAAALKDQQLAARVEAEVAGGDQATRRKVLERLLKERAPDVKLDELKDQFTRAPVEGEKPVLDELEYMNEMTRRLAASEPLAGDALDGLAAARSATVRNVVTTGGALDATRVTVEATQEVRADKSGTLKMKLALEAT
jgi:uncharacterized protein involved in outer membrane biogenesis